MKANLLGRGLVLVSFVLITLALGGRMLSATATPPTASVALDSPPAAMETTASMVAKPFAAQVISNVLVPDVEGQFEELQLHGDPLAFNLGYYDSGTGTYRMDADDPSVYRHYQSILRYDYQGTPYFILTRSGSQGKDPVDGDRPAELLTVEMRSRGTDGERLRSNRLQANQNMGDTVPPASDKAVSSLHFDGIEISKQYSHAGGMQIVENVLVIPLEDKCPGYYEYGDGKCSKKLLKNGALALFNIANPASPSLIFYKDFISDTYKFPYGLGVVGVTRILTQEHDTHRYLYALTWGNSTDMAFAWSEQDGLASTKDIVLATNESSLWNEDCLGDDKGHWRNWQVLNFVREKYTDDLYLIGIEKAAGSTAIDWVGLFKVDVTELYPVNSPTDNCKFGKNAVTYVAEKHLYLNDPDMGSGDAASGIYVSPSGQLILYTGPHDNDGPRPEGCNSDSCRVVEIGEFRNMDVTYNNRLPAGCSGWVELYDDERGWDDGTPDRSLMFDYQDRNEDDWYDLDKYDNGFGDEADSVRWHLPSGQKAWLYRNQNYRGASLELGGSGYYDRLDDYDMGDAIHSVQFSPVAEAGGPYTGTVGVPVPLSTANSCYLQSTDGLTFKWSLTDPACKFTDTGTRTSELVTPTVVCTPTMMNPRVTLAVGHTYYVDPQQCFILGGQGYPCFVSQASDRAYIRGTGGIIYVKPGANGNGSSWDQAANLDAALAAATPDQQVWVAAGIYTPRSAKFNVARGAQVYGGFAGTETDFDQRAWLTRTTILSGTTSYPVVYIWSSTPSLDGLVIRGGKTGIEAGHPRLTLENVVIEHNRDGGIYFSPGDGQAVLSNVTLRDNGTSTTSGGGMYFGGAKLELSNVVITGNTALYGGGLYLESSGDQSLSMTNTLLANNSAVADGGGIYLHATTDQLWHFYGHIVATLAQVTSGGNTAGGHGGGIYGTREDSYCDIEVTVHNSILWDNSPSEIYTEGSLPVITYSDVYTPTGVYPGAGNLNANPRFVTPYSDLHLQSGSPAVNAGDNSAVPPGLTTDLDGNARIVGRVDMGAFERNTPPVAYSQPPFPWGPYVPPYIPVTNEDTPVTITLAGSDPDNQPLTFRLVSLPARGTLTLTGVITRLAYTPFTDTNGLDSFTFLVNDGAADSNVATVWINVYPVNDAPVLDNQGNMVLNAINENDLNNAGTSVPTLIASAGGDRITDVDRYPLEGIAITAVDNSRGGWQYTTQYTATGVTSWYPFTPTISTARLLSATVENRVRFVPNPGWSGTVNPAITFRAWDQTSGSAGGTANTTVNGGTTAFSQASETASIVVNPTPNVWYVDRDATGATHDGLSWTTAFTTVQAALTVANRGDETWVAEGVYTPGISRASTFQLKDGVPIYGGFGGVGISETLRTQRNWFTHPVTLSGDIGIPGDNSDNVYHVVSGSGVTTTLDGFTISGGNAAGTNGGGIYIANASHPTIRNVVLYDNVATGSGSTGQGGGVYVNYSRPTLINVVFRNNRATWGGGMLNRNLSQVTLTHVTFYSNTAVYGGGGAYNHTSNMTLTNAILWGNSGGQITDDNCASSVSYSLVPGWDISGTHNIDTDPQFVDATNGDLRLQPTSLAIDAGDNTALPADNADLDGDGNTYEPLSFDLARHPRLADGAPRDSGSGSAPIVDMGAYEARVLYVDVSAAGDNTGDSWADAFTNLQSALGIAGSGDTIWVAEGTYRPTTSSLDWYASFRLRSGVAIYGGFPAGGGNGTFAARNWAAHVTTLSGDSGVTGYNGDNVFQVVTGNGVTTTAVLDGFTIRDGNARFGYIGGGIYNASGSPTLRNLFIVNNNGGGMANRWDSRPLLLNVVFWRNSAGSGGGMYNYASSPTLINVTFAANTSTLGSALRNEYSSNPVLTNCILWGNTGSSPISNLGSTPVVNYSLVQGGYSGAGNINADPQFMDPERGNLHLRGTSLAIDTGNNAALPADIYDADGDGSTTERYPFDLSGNARMLNHPNLAGGTSAIVDMGAYEARVIYVDRSVAGIGDGSSWPNAFNELRSALASVSSGVEIWVAEGTYKPTGGLDRNASFNLKLGIPLYGGFPADGGNGTFAARDPAAHITTLSGDIGATGVISDNSYHVIIADNTDHSTVLDGFTITGGNAEPENGGGLWISHNGNATIRNVIFRGNTASGSGAYGAGGGMYAGASHPILVNVVFYDNRARVGGGLMVYNGGDIALTNVTFSGNTTTGASGGAAIFINPGCTTTLTNGIVWGNIGTYQITHFDPLTVTYSDVQGGWAGTGNINADPLFLDAASGDLRLRFTSPAVNAGDNAAVPADLTDLDGDENVAESLPYDLLGNPRIANRKVDMGAYEAQIPIVYLPLVLRSQ